MRSMCVFRRKYMHSAALTPVRPPARQPARQPSPASPPASRSASQTVPRASGIILGNANEVRNRSTLRSDPAPPTSSCRGGMGEAQGDPPRHSVKHPQERAGPERRARQIQYSFCDTPIGETRATRPTGPPPPGAPGTRESSTKIAYSGTTCVISFPARIRRSCKPPRCAPWFSS